MQRFVVSYGFFSEKLRQFFPSDIEVLAISLSLEVSYRFTAGGEIIIYLTSWTASRVKFEIAKWNFILCAVISLNSQSDSI